MINRGFIDLLFILLCSTLVLLANAIPLRGLAARPAEAGSGGSHSLLGGHLVVVSVSESDLSTATREGSAVRDLGLNPEDEHLVIVPATDGISHHRMIDVWRTARAEGFRVDLGGHTGGHD